jgi:hypothetical protein
MWNLFGNITAEIEHPLSTSIATKIVPTILRTQHADGSWGDRRSFVVFATLVKHGLLDVLLDLPKLPPDWAVERSIPAPGDRSNRLAWDGEKLWVHVASDHTVVAVSPTDGAILKTISVPDEVRVTGMSLWDGNMVLLTTKPEKALYVIDEAAGAISKHLSLPALAREKIGAIAEIDGKLAIGDHWNGHFHLIEAGSPDRKKTIRTASGIPIYASGHGKEMWVVDALSPAIIKTDLEGTFLDWGEKLFGNRDIAYDGKNLWALDTENNRICMIVKNVPDAERDAKAARAKELLKGQKYGFRYDPMTWIKNDTSVQAARVRTFIFKQPAPGDGALLQQEIDSILATQQPDGSFSKPDSSPMWIMRGTADTIIRLHQLGCSMDRPEVQRAGRRMLAAAEEHGRLDCVALPAACLLGTTDPEIIRKAAKLEARTLKVADPRGGDGTGPKLRVLALLAARDVADHSDAIEHGLRTMRDSILEGAGWPVWCAPWGYVECASAVDSPLAKEITLAQLPMLLRAQHSDGSWGEGGYDRPDPTYLALATLHKWGFLESLRELPALPKDWRVLQTVKLPDDIGDVQSMTWADDRIWLWSRERSEATAIAIPDGTVLKRHSFTPSYYAITWHEEALLLSSSKPPALTWISPETGVTKRRVDCKLPHPWCTLWVVAVADGQPIITTANAQGYKAPALCGSPSIVDMAGEGNSIWHIDAQAGALIRSAVDDAPKLLDWGERPFGDNTTAIAHDGTHLWVLDNHEKKICKIEKIRKESKQVGRAPAF